VKQIGWDEVGREEADREYMRLEREERRARVSAARFEGRLQEFVEEWNGRCAICKVAGKAASSLRHPTYDCKYDRDDAVKKEIAAMRKGFRSDNFAGCRSCGLPQSLCEQWTSSTHGFHKIQGARCQAKWVLIDVVVALISAGPGTAVTESLWQQMMDEGVDLKRQGSVCKWFRCRTKVGYTETNQLCLAFVSLVKGFTEAPRT